MIKKLTTSWREEQIGRDYIHFFSKEVIFDQLKCFSNHYHQQLTLNPTQKNLKKNLNCANDLHYTGLAYHAFYF